MKTVNILCLKHGIKYNSDYVNRLYNMVVKNLNLPFNFYCITEDSKNINPLIKIIQLPKKLNVLGWWYKPYIFSDSLPISGTILYLDLDIVITGSLDKLFSYHPNCYCIIRDFIRVMRPNNEKYNSSVIRFEKGQLDYVWEKFVKNHHVITRKYFGDQDYLYAETEGKAILFPDKWIMSWKWEIRKNKQFAQGGVKGQRKFERIENVEAPKDCCIAVFHGDPNPHLCEDPYIIEKWK